MINIRSRKFSGGGEIYAQFFINFKTYYFSMQTKKQKKLKWRGTYAEFFINLATF